MVRVTREEQLHQILIQAGRTLALRFREHGQYLCSFVAPESLFIDIMMNVPIIFYAANESGDAALKKLATTHCLTTRDRIVRADGSTAHEGIFDTNTGKFLEQTTHQGLRGDSCWARGLAWSLYGYSKCYGLTGNPEFLAVSERNADYWLAHLPADKVSYWDFDADLSQPPPWGAQKNHPQRQSPLVVSWTWLDRRSRRSSDPIPRYGAGHVRCLGAPPVPGVGDTGAGKEF